tara:strand:+ start:757 stop:1134 length:378 start_codon:yes stop_codon:yes gene_type:complete
MAIGFDVGGSLGVVVPDRGMSWKTEPQVLKNEFGDGYTQRISKGLNNLKQNITVNFANRTKADVDDIVAFFETKKGVTAFTFTVPDSNSGSNELAVKVICTDWSQNWEHDDYYSVNATFERVYEA